MFIAIVPIALAAHLLVAVPGGLPSIDIQKSCRKSADAVSGSTTGSIFIRRGGREGCRCPAHEGLGALSCRPTRRIA